MDHNIQDEIERLTIKAANRRAKLQKAAYRALLIKKRLSVFSGVLALVSAGTITTVLVAAFGERVLQILAAATSALSGAIVLVTSSYFRDADVTSMFAGSSKYLALRQKANRLLIQTITAL